MRSHKSVDAGRPRRLPSPFSSAGPLQGRRYSAAWSLVRSAGSGAEPHDFLDGVAPTAAMSRSASRCASSASPALSCRRPRTPTTKPTRCSRYFGYGMGLRVIDLQNNRGDGGQNEIGPELFRDIAVLRTSELLSAHRIDGAEQYFTRAIDYGYSFDPEEVIAKWGRKDIVGDYVRLLRTLRPDVIVTMNIQGRGGDRAHEATTVLVREAFRAAGDPSMYPEQFAGRPAAVAAEEALLRGRAMAVPAAWSAPGAAAGAAADGGRGGRGRGAARRRQAHLRPYRYI